MRDRLKGCIFEKGGGEIACCLLKRIQNISKKCTMATYCLSLTLTIATMYTALEPIYQTKGRLDSRSLSTPNPVALAPE